MDAVVMAAGEGRRLRPVTERYAKPVLPVEGTPVVAALLRELADAGCGRVTVVVGHLAGQIRSLLGDGSAFGVELAYAEQPDPLGSADAVRRALDAGAQAPLLGVAADTLFTPGDLARVVAAAAGFDGVLTARRHPPPEPPHRWPLRIENGLVTRVLDDDPANPLANAPAWVLGPAILPFCEGLGGPPYEIAQALQRAIDAGLRVAGLEIGPTRDLTFPVDLMEQNFPYLKGLGEA